MVKRLATVTAESTVVVFLTVVVLARSYHAVEWLVRELQLFA